MVDKLVGELRAQAEVSQRYSSAIVDARAGLYWRAADALAIAQKRVNELEAALAELYAEVVRGFGPINPDRKLGRALKKAESALPTMLKGNGDG